MSIIHLPLIMTIVIIQMLLRQTYINHLEIPSIVFTIG